MGSLLCFALTFGGGAFAAEPLLEVEGLPFTLAVHPWLTPRLAPMSEQAAFELATVLPPGTVELDILVLNWPKSTTSCWLGVGQSAAAGAGPDSPLTEHLAIVVGEGEPQKILLESHIAGDLLNRVCIWPTSKGEDAQLVFVCSVSGTEQDGRLAGFVVTADGTVRELTTGGALTLYGWFSAEDLDNDGLYELITSRNLDGTWGGFFYHAVRSYDPGTAAYVARPDNYIDYFLQEKEWLDWVLEMQPIIQANPADYLNQSGVGYAYVAEYNGRNYGFDSIIEVPPTFSGVGDVQQFNRGRRAALSLVRTYRAELADWLAGGDYPATWKLSR